MKFIDKVYLTKKKGIQITDSVRVGVEDYHGMMTSSEKISAIMNVVATQQQSSQSLVLNKRPSSVSSMNSKSHAGNKKSEMDLFKLLERANLNQYLAMFSEQGMLKKTSVLRV